METGTTVVENIVELSGLYYFARVAFVAWNYYKHNSDKPYARKNATKPAGFNSLVVHYPAHRLTRGFDRRARGELEQVKKRLPSFSSRCFPKNEAESLWAGLWYTDFSSETLMFVTVVIFTS